MSDTTVVRAEDLKEGMSLSLLVLGQVDITSVHVREEFGTVVVGYSSNITFGALEYPIGSEVEVVAAPDGF